MVIESVCVLLLLEIIMFFLGYLVFCSELVLWEVVVLGVVGCVFGFWLVYVVGVWGGWFLVECYGCYLLVLKCDLDLVDCWF